MATKVMARLVNLFACVSLVSLLSAFVVSSTSSSSSSSISFYPHLEHSNIKRVIDLRSHIEEVTTTIEVTNRGSESISHYLLSFPPSKAARLAYAELSVPSTSSKKSLRLETTRIPLSNISGLTHKLAGGSVLYRASLESPLSPGNSITLTAVSVFTRTLSPYPESISQNDDQYVKWNGSVLFFSPYKTLKQSTLLKLSSSKIESYSKNVLGIKANHRGELIEYQVNDPQNAFSGYGDVDQDEDAIQVHFQNNAPFVTFTTLIREFEVSHWGNVAVEERFELKHTGATLKGGFDRHSYQTHPKGSAASFRDIVATLSHWTIPHSIYYTDRIGNVSTSHVRKSNEGIVVEVEPRYPMFGGWKADIVLGYSLPSQKFLSSSRSSPSRTLLNLTFGSPFPSAAIDELELKIVLPEGTTHIDFNTPFDIDNAYFETKQTYLDTTGRPVLVLRKSNVVPHHNAVFQVAYTFEKMYILIEPAYLVVCFLLFFVCAAVYVRLDFSITRVSSLSTMGKIEPSRRSGKLGDLVNSVIQKIQSENTGLIYLYENASIESLNKADTVLTQIHNVLIELSKESDLNEAARDLELALIQARNSARKYAGATIANGSVAEAKRELREKVEEVERLLEELAIL